MQTQLIQVGSGRTVNNGRSVVIGVQDDKGVGRIVYTGLPNLDPGQLVTLHWVLDNNAGDVVTLGQESGGYLWNIDDSITQYLKDKVLISAYLRITVGDTVRWSSCPFWLRGCGLPDVNTIVEPPTVSAIDQMLQAIQAHQVDMAEQEQRIGDMVADGDRQLSAVTGLANQVAEDAQGVEADKNATHEYMVRAEDAAEGAKGSAQAAESTLDKLTNLNATAKTLPPGSDATVTKTTTPDGYALAFGIPRGDKGDPGKDGSDAEVTAENIQAALGYTPVKDVQMNGESLVQDRVATIPLAGYNRLGVVRLDPAGFAAASVEGTLALVPPTDAQISTHTHTQRPITPSCMDYAVKAAMCDGKGAAWTAAEKKAARERMGIDKAYELIESITTDGTAIVERTQEPDGTPYNFVAVKATITSPKALSDVKTVYARIFCGQISSSTYSSFKENSNYFSRATYTWEKKYNIIAGIVNVPTYIYSAQDEYGGDYSSARIVPDVIVADENFTKLKVYSINNQPVPAGFLIQIYGVRA